MPSVKATRSKCEFRPCRRNGTGSPALCDQHRAALEALGAIPRPGIAQRMGGIVDQILNGHAPSGSQFEQIAADIAGSLLGRTVTIDEVQKTRRGDYSQVHAYLDALRARAAQRPPGPPPQADPTLAAKIEHAKACGRARAVLGFTKDDILTAPVLRSRLRELARKHHPDVQGGSTEKMQRINAAVDLLIESL